ncbi:hypothetical protein Desaci_2769 [Desulfosporosinus acidiphilus SJ4]|uniref:Uncharacterized protein n=1 Tax=Desulfosporosinus acidiphilus (strain DSM 22704 / JCM 16185 / SJ4) TaxID=646529 RepID=I4D7C0_DESAJ|nr:hypothetical protein [Desulfosporosinus acidiphilus]AFM41694.1 hypothetical protein Desaci_2769 [Desulfosporosinus acidiphilus SJ4]
MRKCDELLQRFTLKGQDSGVRELRREEFDDYQVIYNILVEKLIDTGVEITQDKETQVINRIVSQDDADVTPLGLTNVSLEYLARILTFAKGKGIQWHVEIKECSDTHFMELSYFKIQVNCNKDLFVTMAKEAGFRYPKLKHMQTA